MLQSSVRIAREERDRFWKEFQNKVLAGTARAGSRQRALVAASIGSYGAYLADGSEYRYASLGCRFAVCILEVFFACYFSYIVIKVSVVRVVLLVFGVAYSSCQWCRDRSTSECFIHSFSCSHNLHHILTTTLVDVFAVETMVRL